LVAVSVPSLSASPCCPSSAGVGWAAQSQRRSAAVGARVHRRLRRAEASASRAVCARSQRQSLLVECPWLRVCLVSPASATPRQRRRAEEERRGEEKRGEAWGGDEPAPQRRGEGGGTDCSPCTQARPLSVVLRPSPPSPALALFARVKSSDPQQQQQRRAPGGAEAKKRRRSSGTLGRASACVRACASSVLSLPPLFSLRPFLPSRALCVLPAVSKSAPCLLGFCCALLCVRNGADDQQGASTPGHMESDSRHTHVPRATGGHLLLHFSVWGPRPFHRKLKEKKSTF
jgi:hypothetical protein